MITEAVLKQVRDRIGPLNQQAEQAVVEVVKIMQQMDEPSFSPTTSEETEENIVKEPEKSPLSFSARACFSWSKPLHGT